MISFRAAENRVVILRNAHPRSRLVADPLGVLVVAPSFPSSAFSHDHFPTVVPARLATPTSTGHLAQATWRVISAAPSACPPLSLASELKIARAAIPVTPNKTSIYAGHAGEAVIWASITLAYVVAVLLPTTRFGRAILPGVPEALKRTTPETAAVGHDNTVPAGVSGEAWARGLPPRSSGEYETTDSSTKELKEKQQ